MLIRLNADILRIRVCISTRLIRAFLQASLFFTPCVLIVILQTLRQSSLTYVWYFTQSMAVVITLPLQQEFFHLQAQIPILLFQRLSVRLKVLVMVELTSRLSIWWMNFLLTSRIWQTRKKLQIISARLLLRTLVTVRVLSMVLVTQFIHFLTQEQKSSRKMLKSFLQKRVWLIFMSSIRE